MNLGLFGIFQQKARIGAHTRMRRGPEVKTTAFTAAVSRCHFSILYCGGGVGGKKHLPAKPTPCGPDFEQRITI
jgi:hypothetical protein